MYFACSGLLSVLQLSIVTFFCKHTKKTKKKHEKVVASSM